MRTGIVSTLIISVLGGSTLAATDDIVGRWDLQVEPGGYPSWIGVKKEGQRYKVEFLWMGGGVETPPDKARVDGNKVMFRARDMNWEGVAAGDTMTGTATENAGKVNKFTGRRFVPIIDVSGHWKINIDGQSGRAPTVAILQKGTELAGTYRGKKELAVTDAKLEGDTFSFKVQTERGAPDRFDGKVKGDIIEGTVQLGSSKKSFTAERHRDWADPIELFNGKDLTGWKPIGNPKKSRWKAVNGIMTNTDRGANIVSERTFGDMKVRVEFRVPKHSNSGVYLRGRYEIQVEDSSGQRATSGSCGAIYGRITPTENASKPADEWQTFEATLIGQYITLIHNGKKVIDNQEIEGITGGALDVNETDPGPIYLQGDHGSVEYRKVMIWTPAEPRHTASK
jgi:hypothetical protein